MVKFEEDGAYYCGTTILKTDSLFDKCKRLMSCHRTVSGPKQQVVTLSERQWLHFIAL